MHAEAERMSESRREIVLVRHGATEWSKAGRHTGRSDIPLLDEGRAQARALARTLVRWSFAQVLTSPLVRARETAALAGFPGAEVEPDLREWDYGVWDGRTSAEIRTRIPGWTVWSGEIPEGETPDDVGARADRVIARIGAAEGDVAVFAHAHVLRVLAARWIGQDPRGGRGLVLDTATLSILGWERDARVVRRWNVAP
jgi:probable phosphoglycerate mutase